MALPSDQQYSSNSYATKIKPNPSLNAFSVITTLLANRCSAQEPADLLVLYVHAGVGVKHPV